MSRKLIAFDIDGTLLNSQSELLASTIETVKQVQEAGHLVTIATGRSLATAQVVIDALEFRHYVLCNGGYAFVDHQQIHSDPLNKAELKELVALANAERLDIMYQTMHEVKQQGPFIHQKNHDMQVAFTDVPNSFDFDIDNDPAIYQAIVFCNRQESLVFNDRFNSIRFTRWGETAMDAVPLTSSKAVTLKVMAEQAAIASKDIVVFGDGENDIEMLQLAGTGIAMGNASDYVKGFASHITKSNDHDGIWHAAKEHQLI